MSGILYIVATPIGNLQDITLRAIETLKKVQYIACEDTRRAGQLLKAIGREDKPFLTSFYEGVEYQRMPNLLNVLLNGNDVALISDAGTPGISDPGFTIVRECIAQGIQVVSIPGPSAVISALVSSGLPTDKFLFLGYLPKKPGNRLKLLENVKESLELVKSTVIIYETPHRLLKSLQELQEMFGDIEIVIARELTKIHEEIRKDVISNHIAHFEKTPPKGEFVLLFNRGDINE